MRCPIRAATFFLRGEQGILIVEPTGGGQLMFWPRTGGASFAGEHPHMVQVSGGSDRGPLGTSHGERVILKRLIRGSASGRVNRAGFRAVFQELHHLAALHAAPLR